MDRERGFNEKRGRRKEEENIHSRAQNYERDERENFEQHGEWETMYDVVREWQEDGSIRREKERNDRNEQSTGYSEKSSGRKKTYKVGISDDIDTIINFWKEKSQIFDN